MRAAVVTRFGGPEVFELTELSDPVPGPGQVAIDVTYAAVGLVDINRALVEAGMAVALPKETTDYVAAEAEAKAKSIGVWRGPFTAPADYREMLAGHPQDR